MKKAMMLFVLVVLGVMLMALPANAAYYTLQTHGGFGTGGSTGCADCHTTHAANAAFLLASGPTETDACFACHGAGATASPYDVVNGAMSNDYTYINPTRTVWSNGNIYPSYAGGFIKSYKFADPVDAADTGYADVALTAAQGPGGGSSRFDPSLSAHNVEESTTTGDIPGTAWSSGATNIPGGANIVTGSTFKCGSCHDPHGGATGSTTAFEKARLLKKTVATVDVSAAALDFSANAAASMRITQYPVGINTWCGGCHGYFNAGDQAGHAGNAAFTTNNPNSKYRHPMGVIVNQAPTDATIGTGTPLTAAKELTCFSCHRAHGTASDATGAASTFGRYTDTGSARSGSGSVLLRLKGRDTCYNCHGAATANTYTGYHLGGGLTHS